MTRNACKRVAEGTIWQLAGGGKVNAGFYLFSDLHSQSQQTALQVSWYSPQKKSVPQAECLVVPAFEVTVSSKNYPIPMKLHCLVG